MSRRSTAPVAATVLATLGLALVGALVVALVIRHFLATPAARLARQLRLAGGAALLVAGVGLLFLRQFALALPVAPAHAHFGHLGELAGHSHWIGLAGLAAAAATAALIARGRRRTEDKEAADAPEDEEGTASAGQPAA